MLDRTGKSVFFSRQATVPDLKAREGDYVLDFETNKLVRLSQAESKIQEKNSYPACGLRRLAAFGIIEQAASVSHRVRCDDSCGVNTP
jgi:hypothetical protein